MDCQQRITVGGASCACVSQRDSIGLHNEAGWGILPALPAVHAAFSSTATFFTCKRGAAGNPFVNCVYTVGSTWCHTTVASDDLRQSDCRDISHPMADRVCRAAQHVAGHTLADMYNHTA
jgi:hypothetical protein